MNDKKKDELLVIWGTGKIGRLAYHQYINDCNIFGYIDSDKNKWESELNGLKIYSPDILREKRFRVVIALKNGIEDVEYRLKNEFYITTYTKFSVEEQFVQKKLPIKHFQANSIIIFFCGGLGNQLFQYVLYKFYEIIGKKVYANLSFYNNPNVMRFQLNKVFNKIKINECVFDTLYESIKEDLTNLNYSKKYEIYVEPTVYEVKEKQADMSLLNITGGVIKGLFQTSVFCKMIEEQLRTILVFQPEMEYKLLELGNSINQYNSISIHIRRGDYLQGNNQWIYGGICTEKYYEQAIQYMQEHVKECKICFFSDDIEWVKKIYKIPNAIYIEKDLFDNYQDWYDMYLMSMCKHNIIANSTFSWWGAWLNSNRDKIVIAPRKWVNQCEYIDIYPKDWIVI